MPPPEKTPQAPRPRAAMAASRRRDHAGLDPDSRYWSVSDIAEAASYSVGHVRNRLTQLPSFPRPVRLPTPSGKGKRRWLAGEVKAWLARHRTR